MRYRSLNQYLLEFRDFLLNEKNKVNTINNTMTFILSFYKEFYIERPNIKQLKKTKSEDIDDIPKKEDILKALKYANTKYQAIIMLISSSGMGSAELRSLKYHDLLKSLKDYIMIPDNQYIDIYRLIDLISQRQLENPLIVPTWKIKRIKNNNPIITFCTTESLSAILEYLKHSPPVNLESPLFNLIIYMTVLYLALV